MAGTCRGARARHRFCRARRDRSGATRCNILAVNYQESPMRVAGAYSVFAVEVAAGDWLLEMSYKGEVLEGLMPVC